MSYDLQITSPAGIDAEKGEEALARVGVELEGDEGIAERGELVAQFLVDDGEIGVGITGDGGSDSFRELLELVLTVAESLGATVFDPQAENEVGRGNLEAAVEAFG